MWFEWNEYCGFRESEVEIVDVEKCVRQIGKAMRASITIAIPREKNLQIRRS